MKVTAHVTRSDRWWAIQVPQAPGVFTQTKRLDQVPAMVADAVALILDVDAASVHVDVVPEIGGEVDEHLRQARESVAEAARSQREASERVRKVVHELRDDHGFSVRDVGVLLDVSPQRVSQLTG